MSEAAQAITLYVLLMPITLVGLYCALLGLLDLATKLKEGDSLWIGGRQADLFMEHRRTTGEWPDIDSLCLRRRTWRRWKRWAGA